ncbi:hypothetical protein BDQ12DRAFT_116091 [Crucibulum laeve]|uniref:F-box domain-containing protein n=1 Tax=Crucibulum laeve TaxID=68775 RepID=A0A5C3M1A7_9AGAR|nr:hypothetical protein BDQ12DRAFT_116091 [Crucibulum laeve]
MMFLPPEIIDDVLSQLYADYRTLFQCCLVSRKWLPAGRHIIFETLRGQLTSDNCSQLLEILSSPLTTLPIYLRHLIIVGEGTYSAPLPTRHHQRFEYVLNRLSSLRGVYSLTFKNLRWETLSFATQSSLIRTFRYIKELSLQNFSCLSATVMFTMICNFTSLSRLSSDGVELQEPGSICGPPCASPPQITAIRLIDLVPWSMQSTIAFLRWIGPSLEHLVFCGHTYAPQSLSLGGYPEIDNNHRLRSIHIGNYNLIPFSPIVRPITLILSGVGRNHTQLTKIVLELRITESQISACSGWQDVDNLLRQPQFSRLRMVEVMLSFFRRPGVPDQGVSASVYQAREALRNCLPSCFERGILRLRLCIFLTSSPIVVAACQV